MSRSTPRRRPSPRRSGSRWPLPTCTPEAAGFSAGGLDRLHRALDRTVDDGSHAGYVLLLARDGRIVDWRAHGWRDAVARRPLARDDVFRIFSMTKLFTSVAALALVEDGLLRLDDPVARHLPALGAPKVLAGGTAETPVLVAAAREITIRDLLTHTSGFTYEDADLPPALLAAWARAAPWAAEDLPGFVARVATLPLLHQPGTAFRYGISTEILGAVVEQASGKGLDAVFEERISGPLGLADTAFWIPEEKRERLAVIHQRGPDGRLALEGMFNAQRPTATRGMRSGGGGLYSTAPDYARFAQMLLDGGRLEGVRILGRKTVELMTQDHLGALADPHPMAKPWQGFGLGVRVTTDLGQSPTLGTVGAFGWDGMATTLVEIDPRERLVAIVLYQHVPFNEGDPFSVFRNGVYAALEDGAPARRRSR
jgi:CubicO group peptidase (beta-lactamase class C family)